MSSALRRLIAGTCTVVLLIVGVQLLGVSAASAHANVVTGTAACAADGTYAVTWTITNDWKNSAETATVTGHTPSSAALSAGSVALAKAGTNGDSATIRETGVPGSATSAGLTVHGVWTDAYAQSDSGSVALAGTCLPAHTAVAPTWTDGACVDNAPVSPTVTIPTDAGVAYRLDGTPRTAGEYPVSDGQHTVTASSSTLDLGGGQTSWTFTVHAVVGDCLTVVSPADPTVVESVCDTDHHPTNPTLTLPADTAAVTYSVDTPAPYTAGEKVTVTAKAGAGYKFGGAADGWTLRDSKTQTWTVTFHAAPTCTIDTTPVLPGVTQSVCDGRVASPPALAFATTPGITYTANPASGWQPGDTVELIATLADGYAFSAATTTSGWTVSGNQATQPLTFAAAPVCTTDTNPVAPTVVQATCPTGGHTPSDPTLTTVDTADVHYTHGAVPTADQTPASVTVTATAQGTYVFAATPPAGWDRVSDTVETYLVTFVQAPDCRESIRATTASFADDVCKGGAPTQATYTIPATTGVDYYVGTDLTKPGTYRASDGSTITVVAKPQAGYVLAGTTTFTHHFAATPTCRGQDTIIAVRATFTDGSCTGNVTKPGTYTVPGTEGVTFTANGKPVAPGTYPGTDGSTVTLVATAKTGYELRGTTTFTHTFRTTGECFLAVTGVPTASLLGIGIGLLLVGGACTFLAVSRRRRTG